MLLRARPPRWLRLHGCPQDAIDARLVTSAVSLQPLQHVRVKADGELLLGRRPGFRCPSEEGLVERRNVRIVDLVILHAVNSSQVAFDRFLAHVDLPFAWR